MSTVNRCILVGALAITRYEDLTLSIQVFPLSCLLAPSIPRLHLGMYTQRVDGISGVYNLILTP
jgi:hypothetical protein